MSFFTGYLIGRSQGGNNGGGGSILALFIGLIAAMIVLSIVLLPASILVHLTFLLSSQPERLNLPPILNFLLILLGIFFLWPIYVNAFFGPKKVAAGNIIILIVIGALIGFTHDPSWRSIINEVANSGDFGGRFYLIAAVGIMIIAGLTRLLMWGATDQERSAVIRRFTKWHQSGFRLLYKGFLRPILNSRIICVVGLILSGLMVFSSIAMGVQRRSFVEENLRAAAPNNGWDDARVAELISQDAPYIEWSITIGFGIMSAIFLMNLVRVVRQRKGKHTTKPVRPLNGRV